MLARTLGSFRQVALVGGLAAACALLGATRASAAWETPKTIDNGGSGYGAANAETALATAADGTTTSLFFQTAPGTPSGVPGSVFMVRRSGGAAVGWTVPAAVTTPAGQVAPVPQPTLSPAGTDGLFWFQPPTGNAQLLSTAWPPSAGGPSPAAGIPCTSGTTPECPLVGGGAPQLAFDASGQGYAVADGSSGDILVSRTDPATGAWTPPAAIGQGSFPRIAVDPAGDVVITYVRTDNSIPVDPVNRLYVRREPAGQAGFGPEEQISGSGSVDEANNAFALVIDPSGTATAVFGEQPTPASKAIEAVRWPLGSAAPAGEQQISGSPQSEGPLPGDATAAVDPQGNVTAAWDSASPNSAVYAARFTGAAWGAPVQISPANGRGAVRPALAADAAGTVTLIYTDSSQPTGSDVDIKASRLALGGTWSGPVSLRSTDPSAGAIQTGSADVAASKAGQADVTFVQQIGGVNHVLATRFDDTTRPTIEVVIPQDGATYRQGTTVLADYSCADEPGGSGIASCTGAARDGEPIDTSHPGPGAFTVTAVDGAGNAATKTVRYTVLAGPAPKDTTPPRITLTAPVAGAVYAQRERVIAHFSCADPDSAVSSCRGTAANGRPIDTRSLGRHTFSVIARDPAGNTASKTVHYTVKAATSALLALRLTVVPRHVRTGRAVRLRFRVASCASRRCRGVPGALISFGRRRVRADRRGYATITVTLRKAGHDKAYARAPGYRRATAVVIARAR